MQNSESTHFSALYPWFAEHGTDLVHPDDLAEFKALMPYGKVFEVLPGAVEGMVRLAYGAKTFRVLPDLLREVKSPRFRVGDSVRLAGRNEEGIVDDVMWHQKGECPFYKLNVRGKKMSKRYWEADLEFAPDKVDLGSIGGS
jgi:hypothetical protein